MGIWWEYGGNMGRLWSLQPHFFGIFSLASRQAGKFGATSHGKGWWRRRQECSIGKGHRAVMKSCHLCVQTNPLTRADGWFIMIYHDKSWLIHQFAQVLSMTSSIFGGGQWFWSRNDTPKCDQQRSPWCQWLESQAMLEEAVSRQTDRVWAKDLWSYPPRQLQKNVHVGSPQRIGKTEFYVIEITSPRVPKDRITCPSAVFLWLAPFEETLSFTGLTALVEQARIFAKVFFQHLDSAGGEKPMKILGVPWVLIDLDGFFI